MHNTLKSHNNFVCVCVCVCTCDVVMENLPIVVMIDLESVAAIDDTGEVLIIVV